MSAETVISKFGGQSALARLIGKGPSTVQHWSSQGVIPAKWHAQLLQLALDQGIDLSPADFVAPVSGEVIERPPKALMWGDLMLGDDAASCYVLDDGRRVISRTGATDVLTGKRGGGNLESYIEVTSLSAYPPGPGKPVDRLRPARGR